MFANSYQSGFISIFYSVGSNPLSLWDKQVKNGHIRRVIDDQVKSLVLEISGTNVATTYITCPIKPRASLGIKLPFLVMVIKNMKKYFTFEIQILDDKDMHRRFRVSNFQSTTKVRPFCTTMPIGLGAGWNQVQFNLADFTKRAYGSTYVETMRVQVHANVRVRRIYFSDTLYSEEEMPNEFKLFAPSTQKKKQLEAKPSKDMTKEQQHQPVSKLPLEEIPPPPSPIEEESKVPASPVDVPADTKPPETGDILPQEIADTKTQEMPDSKPQETTAEQISIKENIEDEQHQKVEEVAQPEMKEEETKEEQRHSEHIEGQPQPEEGGTTTEPAEVAANQETETPALGETEPATTEETNIQHTEEHTEATTEETTATEATVEQSTIVTGETEDRSATATEAATTDDHVADEPTTTIEPTSEAPTETDNESPAE